MRHYRGLAIIFAVIFALTPLLSACQRQPKPAPPATSTGTAAQASAVPSLVPTATPTRAPLPPVVVETTPAPGEEQKVDAPLVVTFDQAMDSDSTTQAFSIEPKVPGRVKVDGSRLTFTPDKAFERAAQYQVKLDANASSARGLKMLGPVTFKVSTAGYLLVSGNQPADQTQEVPVDTRVVVSFNRPVVPLTGVQDQASLPQPLIITPTVAGKGEWLTTSIYQFAPANGLDAATQYSVTVKSGLTDTTGGILTRTHTFGFTTNRPTITGWAPEVPSWGVRVEKPISVTFSMAMDHVSTESAFRLNDNHDNAVSGTFTWNAASTQMGFQPAQRLSFGTRYVASVGTSARPANGHGTLASESSFSFDTVSLPRIMKTNPFEGQTNADPYAGVMFQFNTPMDPATFVSGTVTVLPKPTQVYTNYNEMDHSYYVSFEKLPDTAYTVVLAGRLADTYGNTLGQDFALHFRTADYPPMFDLNTPGQVGTYNAYTNTAALVTYRNTPWLDFSLYRVPVEDFIRLTGQDYWSVWENYRPSEANLVHQWSVETTAKRNETALLRVPLTGQDEKPLGTGLFVLQALGSAGTNAKANTARQLLARTDLNVTLKSSASSALAWVTDLKSGLPVAGVSVRFTDAKKVNQTATTDQNGVAQVTFPDARQPWEPLLALATASGDRLGVASSTWENGISPWDFNLGNGVTAGQYMGYVYTDRPIYRPGQTVYWKAIVRRDNDALYSIPPAGQPVTATITDDRGNKLLEQRLQLSPSGTIDGKLALGPEASLGYYFAQVQLDKDTQFGAGFQVSEYRKPEYEIKAETDKPEYVQGDQIKVTVQANYFFGGPVKNAKVRWTLLSREYSFVYKPPRDQEANVYYSFADWDWFDYQRTRQFGQSLGEGNGVTDDRGQFVVSVPADIARFAQSQTFTVDLTITDANNQAVSAQATAVVHKGDFYIGLHPQSYVATAGEANLVDVLTVDTKSQPVARTEVTLVANQVTWYSVREQAEDGRFYWTTRSKQTPVYTQTLTTAADGKAVFKWTPGSGGEYKIEATGRDRSGHQIRSAAFIWVSGSGYVNWRQENNDRIQLVADKDEYKVGDTAHLLVASPYQGRVKALLTVERNHVLSHQVIDVQGNSQTLNIPIQAELAPNAYVSLTLIKGMDATSPSPSFKVGLAQLKVSVADKQLQVIVTPDRKQAGPRDTVTWDVQTLDTAGKPVANADVSLALIDKAVLSLADDQSGTLMDRFYSERALGVRTASTLVVNVDRIVAQLTKGSGKGGGGGGGGEAAPVRREFPDVAYWTANLATGADGKAQVKVVLPDNLTTWTMDARAVTPDTLVGQSKTDLLVTKDLLVRPVLPRFFVQGDRAEIAAIVNNNTGEALDVTVDMQASGLRTSGGNVEQRQTVAAQSSAKVVWPVIVEPNGQPALLEETKIQFRAAGGGLNDAVEITLPVYHYTTPEVTGTSGQVGPDEQRLELVRFPLGSDPTRGELDVTLEPSLAAGITGGLKYLEHYPYECVEQTLSRFLPNVVTYQALKTLGIQRPDLEASLPQQVSIGLQRLYARQHVDGGWGWWQEDTSDLFISSYVIFGLAKAQEAGFTVDKNVLDRGVRYVKQNLRAPADLSNWKLNEQAFMIYALATAGEMEPNRAGALFEARDRLSTYAKGYLALALAAINDDAAPERIKTLLADFTGKAILSATSAHWEEDWVDYYNMNTDTRTTAIIVDVLATLDPKNSLAPNAVRWLMVARKGDRWETTQENAWAIMALTDWMAATGELQGNYSWQVRLNDGLLDQGKVAPANVDQTIALRADVQRLLLDQTNSLVIERSVSPEQKDTGQLYYTAHLKSYQPVDKIGPLNRGITISRQYQMAECTGTSTPPGPEQNANPTPAQSCPAVTEARVGDVLNVKLNIVVANQALYLVVEDPLPAGLEAVDTSLKTTSQTAEGPSMKQTGPAEGKGTGPAPYVRPYWWWSPSHTDMRDEKTVMFATSLQPGTYEFNYQVRATLPGQFLTLPPDAYQMYFPEVQGRGAGSVFVVKGE